MPQPHTAKLPRPKNADEFEDMCVEALRIRWGVHPQRNGRSGQGQDGVDIFGRVPGAYVGAQCKNTDNIDLTSVRHDSTRARAFKPKLAGFVVVTTALRDARLHEAVRVHFHENPEAFTVDLLFWEDIEGHLTSDSVAVAKFWSLDLTTSTWAPRRQGELHHLRAEVARIAKFGEDLNVGSYTYRQIGQEVPPRAYSETCGASEFETLWSRLSSTVPFDDNTRMTMNDLRDAMRAWDADATEFGRRLRMRCECTEADLGAQDQSARTYGRRMQNDASRAGRLVDQLLGAST